MHSRIVIINTSPLFYLHRIRHLHILEKLYEKIVVPQAVVSEFEEGGKLGEDVPKDRRLQLDNGEKGNNSGVY